MSDMNRGSVNERSETYAAMRLRFLAPGGEILRSTAAAPWNCASFNNPQLNLWTGDQRCAATGSAGRLTFNFSRPQLIFSRFKAEPAAVADALFRRRPCGSRSRCGRRGGKIGCAGSGQRMCHEKVVAALVDLVEHTPPIGPRAVGNDLEIE